MRLQDRGVKPVKTAPGLGRDSDQGCPAQLWQQAFEHLAHLCQLFLLLALQVPFVHGNHDRAAFGFGIIRNPQILLLKRCVDVQQHHDDFGEPHGAQAVGNRQLFHLVTDPRLFAHAGGVENPDRRSQPVGPDRDRIAGDAGLGAGQHPLFAQNLVDQRRFAGVRAADDGDLQRTLFGWLVRVRIGL